MTVEQWLIDLLNGLDAGLHWTTRRRVVILGRWPERRQLEAHSDALMGKPETAAVMAVEIAAIKLAIPKA